MGGSVEQQKAINRSSLVGLNAINFFQAEMVGVVLPVLGAFLVEAHWRYDAIGLTTAIAGLGPVLFQTPAGMIADRAVSRRLLFGIATLVAGICLTLIPVIPHQQRWVDTLLFTSGAVQTLVGPLFGALALGLVGHEAINRIAGINQGWNHAGNIVAALLGIILVRFIGIRAVFYACGVSSLLAVASVLFIRPQDIDEHLAAGLGSKRSKAVSWHELFRDRTIVWLAVSIFLFHLANAPILPAVALYVKKLGGSDGWMTGTVLTAQIVMVPVALFAGRYGDRWGRKLTMAIAFWVLPLRIFAYTLVSGPKALVFLQSLAGLFATAVAVGGVTGPLLSGFLIQHGGFRVAFCSFALLALVGARVFTSLVPETKHAKR
jgi:MFS family permease